MHTSRHHFAVVLIFFHTVCTAQIFVAQRSTASSVLTIGAIEFEHTKKSENGVSSEQFLIKGVPVEKEQYYEQLHAARVKMMHDEQQVAEQKEQERSLMRDGVQRALLEKLIATSTDDLTQDLEILEKSVLKPYLFFDMAGIRSQADLEQVSGWLKQISKSMKSFFAQSDIVALHSMADDLQVRLELVRNCLKKSIEKATAQCDDTQVLKELLALVEA